MLNKRLDFPEPVGPEITNVDGESKAMQLISMPVYKSRYLESLEGLTSMISPM